VVTVTAIIANVAAAAIISMADVAATAAIISMANVATATSVWLWLLLLAHMMLLILVIMREQGDRIANTIVS
jgi:hypothetical protein